MIMIYLRPSEARKTVERTKSVWSRERGRRERSESSFSLQLKASCDVPICLHFLLFKVDLMVRWGHGGEGVGRNRRRRRCYFNRRIVRAFTSLPAVISAGHVDTLLLGIETPLQPLSWRAHGIPMSPTPLRSDLGRLCTYLEELEATELKKFKLYLGTATEMGEGKIPWGRMEPAGPLEMAQLLAAHFGPREAWLLTLGVFQRINRKDLWERGQREDLGRGKDDGPG